MVDRNNSNDEQLKELLGDFFSFDQAQQAFDEIKAGDRLTGRFPSPQPDAELIFDIKSKIADTLARKRKNAFRMVVYKVAAVAAVLFVIAGLSVKMFDKNQNGTEKLITASIIPKAIWETVDIIADDANLATFTAEIEQIELELMAVRVNENGGNGFDVISEIEQELIEVNTTFWEG